MPESSGEGDGDRGEETAEPAGQGSGPCASFPSGEVRGRGRRYIEDCSYNSNPIDNNLAGCQVCPLEAKRKSILHYESDERGEVCMVFFGEFFTDRDAYLSYLQLSHQRGRNNQQTNR